MSKRRRRKSSKAPEDKPRIHGPSTDEDLDPETEALNRRLDSMVKIARTCDLEPWGPYYADGRRYLFDDQLAHRDVVEGWERVQLNKILPSVLQEQSIQTQVRRTIKTNPVEPGDQGASRLWDAILAWEWEKNLDGDDLMQKCRWVGKQDGHYAVRLYWNPRNTWDAPKREWRGQLRREVLRNELLGIDPETTITGGKQADWRYAYVYCRAYTEELLAEHPDHRQAILQAAESERQNAVMAGPMDYAARTAEAGAVVTDDSAGVQGETDRMKLALAAEGRLVRLLNQPPAAPDISVEPDEDEPGERQVPAFVNYLEIWFRDGSEEDVTARERFTGDEALAAGYRKRGTGASAKWYYPDREEVVSDADWPRHEESYKAPKYPHGRHVIRVGDRHIILDQAWPLLRWPIVVGQNVGLPHTWHGLNAAEMARGGQDWVNIVASHICNYIKYFSDPAIKAELGALAEDPELKEPHKHLQAIAGAIWKLAKGGTGAVGRDVAPPLSEAIVHGYQLFVEHLQDQLGMHDIGLGKQTTPKATATEIVNLQTNTRLRTALQDYHANRFIEQLMEVAAMFRQHHWTVEDFLRVAGETLAPEELAAVAPRQIDVDFDIKVEAVVNLPHDKQYAQLQATELYQIAPTPTTLRRVLKAYEVPPDELENILNELAMGVPGPAEGEEGQSGQSGASAPAAEREPATGAVPQPV